MRTRFITQALCILAALGLASAAQAQTRIRIVASNTTSGNNQSYQAPGTNILKALKPDIALMNEFQVDSGTLAQWVSTTFGPEYSFSIEGGAQIPNGVVSRWPIRASGEYDDPEVTNRDFAWARIDIPGDRDLWAISVHLLTASSSVRNAEAQVIINNMIPSLNIPTNDYIVLGGDFNTDNRTESCISTLRAKFTIASPYPADQNGNGNTNAGRNKPYDWVVVSPNLHSLETPFTYGTSSFAAGFVFDSREFTQSELNSFFPPVQVSDSGATNMQHMAVIRDFLVPDGGTTPTFTVSSSSVNFGTGLDVNAGPFNNSSILLTIPQPIQITGFTITGTNASQFSLTSPNLGTLPATLSTNTNLAFRFTPTANDGQTRTATANFTTNASPSNFSITLSGATQTSGGGGGGGEGAIYFQENFDSTSLPGSYLIGTFTAPSGTWTANSVFLEATTESCSGRAARINDDTAGAYLQTPALTQGAGTLVFRRRELNTGGGTLRIEAATAASGPYSLVQSVAFSGTSCTTVSVPIQRTGTVYLRIVNDNQAGHLIIDELTLTSYTEVPAATPHGWLVN